ncbi:MAG: 7-carboxy-7-deazaguanine synthase QueE [Dysgonamonadaceae bacterium]|jgi:organic radical activating enzyme|nr:7-carboxy-7-deazaguanine synthase QueE [Dysgonamonadaceae bacterium]
MNLNVKEIFYSLQGEGGRQGEASIFIRLTRCNLKCSFCDTDFKWGKDMSFEQIFFSIRKFPCRWIVWTGGEPTLQLTDEALSFFKNAGFLQAIESNGHNKLSELLDYTVVSPKGKKTYVKKTNPRVDEVRLPVREGDVIPPLEILPEAKFFFLSPVFTKDNVSTQANINYCVEQVKRLPQWRLSLQIHKLIGIE